MNKKQINRYSLGQICGIETRYLKSEDYLKELLNNIKKYNNNSKNPYLLGNIIVNRKENVITFNKYKKISVNTTLEEIDKCTTKLKSDYDLKLLYGTNLKNNHPIVIMYRANRDIKTLPLIYKKDKDYLDSYYVKSTLIKHSKSYLFISKILDNKLILSHSRKSLDDLDSLYTLRESIKNNYPINIDIGPLLRFYASFIIDSKDNKYSYFNFRLISLLLIDYEKDTKEEIEEHEEIIGQTMIREYVLEDLRDMYEELKLAICDGNLDEVYQKILIKRH